MTNVDTLYNARTMPDYRDYVFKRQYLDSRAEVVLGGALGEELDAYTSDEMFMGMYGGYMTGEKLEDHRWELGVMGVPADIVEQEMEYGGVYKGDFDLDKFAAGEGIIWRSPDAYGIAGGTIEGGVQPGDVVSIGFYNNEGNCVEKEMTVLAVMAEENMYGSDFGISSIVISDTLFKELYPDYDQWISRIQIDTEKEITEEQHQQLYTLMSEEYNTQLNLESRYTTRVEMGSQKQTFQLIGFLLAGLLGMIGISNLVNTITSDVFARKIELAAMQSIGMTKKQLWEMLLTDTLKFTSVSIVLMLVFGGIMSHLVTQNPLFTGFNARIFVLSAVLLVLLVIGICVFMAWILVKILNQKSIVERLREIE